MHDTSLLHRLHSFYEFSDMPKPRGQHDNRKTKLRLSINSKYIWLKIFQKDTKHLISRNKTDWTRYNCTVVGKMTVIFTREKTRVKLKSQPEHKLRNPDIGY